jgi:ATP-dependent Clp protease protease subunit
VHINSPGGGVFSGIAIHNTLKNHSALKSVYIDGMAASIASVIAMAGDEIIMPKNSMMMIHNPMSWAVGYEEDLRKEADLLAKVKTPILESYMARNKKIDKDKISQLMNAETWMTAEEAVELGFADKFDAKKEATINMSDNGRVVLNGVEFDIGLFKAFPMNKIPAKKSMINSVPATQTDNNSTTSIIFNHQGAADVEALHAIKELQFQNMVLKHQLNTLSKKEFL